MDFGKLNPFASSNSVSLYGHKNAGGANMTTNAAFKAEASKVPTEKFNSPVETNNGRTVYVSESTSEKLKAFQEENEITSLVAK